MNERVRVLASAAQLGRFTAYDLASVSGVKRDSVRSILRRHASFFEIDVTRSDERSRGRPANVYVVANQLALDNELGQVRDSLEWAAVPTVETPAAEHALARIAVAETSLRRAFEATSDEQRDDLVGVALETADVMLREGALGDPDALGRVYRLRAIGEMINAAQTPTIRHQSAMSAAAAAIADLAANWRSSAIVLLRTLMSVAERLNDPPPLGVIVTNGHDRSSLLGPQQWLSSPISGTGDTLWAPRWSKSLVEGDALAGIVLQISATDAANVEHALAPLQTWTPTVITGRPDRDLMSEAAAGGAMFVPDDEENVLASAAAAIAASLDRNIASLGIERDSVLADVVAATHNPDAFVGFAATRTLESI